MALKKDKTKILLPRREVLLKGGLGALGMAIGATALPFKGAWAMDSSKVQSSVSKIRMADWNPTMRLNGLGDSLNSKVFMKNMG